MPSVSTVDSVQAPPGAPDESAERSKDNEAGSARIRLQQTPSSESSPTDVDKSGEIVIITRIRATDVVPDFGRIPVGCYTAVRHSGLEWRTKTQRVAMGNDAVEWAGPILVPSDPSATVHLEICGSFELQPMLGSGEKLWRSVVTVQQLLDYDAQCLPTALFQEDGDVAFQSRTLSVTVRRQERENNVSWVLPCHSPTESQRELEDATDRGRMALSCYEEHDEKEDLEHSIKSFERALDLCPPEHPCRAAAQSNLALAKLMYCRLDDTDLSLNVPLTLYRGALATRPFGHPDRPFTLILLASVYFARFEKEGDEADLTETESLLHEAIDLSPASAYEEKLAATMLRLYAQRVNDAVQTSDQSPMQQDSTSDPGDMDSSSLGIQLLKRFEQSANLADLEQAISVLESFLEPIPALDGRYFEPLANLGLAYLYRFRHLGELRDLENSVSALTHVADLTSDAHPNKPAYSNNLGDALQHRYRRLGNQIDLEEATSRFKVAVDITPDNHPDKCIYLCSLGSSLRARFDHIGDQSDLNQAISMLQDAVDLTPHSHPNKFTCLSNLANCFLVRFRRLGEVKDIDQAILMHKRNVDSTPSGHPDKAKSLNNLGTACILRFQRFGDSSDLEQAILAHKDAVDLTPDGRPDKPEYLNSLGTALLDRFLHLGESGDLEQAITKQRDAVNLTPNGHLGKPACLNNLGYSFFVRFDHFGSLGDLDQAVSKFKSAIEITPDDHPNKPNYLNVLGDALLARFEHLGDLNDLERAISMQEKAVSSVSHGLPEKRRYLNNLGNSLCVRFERLGELSDLERAISSYRNAVDLTPDDHPDKSSCLNNLGNAIITRFERLGESSDLERAISTFGDAINFILKLDGQPNKPAYLINFSTCLLTRFEHLGELNDLEQAIMKLEEAVDLIPKGHPDKAICLSILGQSLFSRFESLGEQHDLEQAISVHRDAVELTQDGHIYKPLRVNSLGKSLLARYKLSGEPRDLEQTVLTLRNAIDLTPDGNPDKPRYLGDLGDSFQANFERVGNQSDLERAISLYSRAACTSIGSIVDRFSASQRWIACARVIRHHSLLDAYSITVGLLPQLAWIGLSLAKRYRELMQGADVVREAAAAALDAGHPETAVEWLEQGRSIVWGELFQLRSSYDELSSAYPDHAHRLRELSAALEQAGATREMVLSPVLEGATGTDRRVERSLEKAADRHRLLAIERDKSLREIRTQLPGFERFLLHREFSQLRASAHTGPVVILNGAEHRCDALIVLADVESAIHVPLPNYTLERSKGLQKRVRKLLGLARAMYRDERAGQPVPQEALNQWQLTLSPLWKCVVKPVLDALAISTPGELPRIFWCPTGPLTFLPIHAAGFYDHHHSQPGNKVFDFVVSSYVPTLSILLPPREPAKSNDNLCLLAVRQPASDGLSQLPGVEVELEHIRAVITDSPLAQTTLAESTTGTVEEVLDLMKDADWVHFACHGIQDDKNPTRSGLCLADGRRLQLSDMMTLSRPRGGLAFLSACQTAMGDEELSDEAIHIAAGMLFAGYGGVVGTMWSISDRLAPRVTRDVYTQLFRGGRPDYLDAARALQDAVGRLRNSPDVGFVNWLPFIHVGL